MVAIALVLAVSIFRCVQADGGVEFRGTPCAERQRIAPVRQVDATARGLSQAERDALQDLTSRLAKNASRSEARRATARRTAAVARAERRRDCEAARLALDALRERKRRGYAAKDARKLDADERRLLERRAASC